jgi:hypothetical protein
MIKTGTHKAYHGTTSLWGLKAGDILEERSLPGSVNGGAWATISLSDAKEYAREAVERFGGDPVVLTVECEDCDFTHDNTTWAYSTRRGGEIRVTGQKKCKIDHPFDYK